MRAKRYEGTSDEQTGTWLEAYTVCRWRALFPHLCPGTSRESSSTRATASTRETCWSRLCTKWFAYYILVRYVYFYCRNEFNEFPYHAGWGNCWGCRSCEEPLKGLRPDVVSQGPPQVASGATHFLHCYILCHVDAPCICTDQRSCTQCQSTPGRRREARGCPLCSEHGQGQRFEIGRPISRCGLQA